jgi:hypothetical protein
LRGTMPPTELLPEETNPVIEFAIGKTLANSKIKIKHNVKCPVCGHIHLCKHGNDNNTHGSYN